MAQRKRLTDPFMITAFYCATASRSETSVCRSACESSTSGGTAAHCGMALTPVCAPRPVLICAARRLCAAAQCLHEIDHPLRRGKGLPALWNGAGLLGLQMRQQCLLVAVAEGRGVKLAGLAVENMLGQREHVRRNGEVGQVAEVILGLAHLIGVAKRSTEKPLVVWLKRNHPLALREHEPPECRHPLAAHGFANPDLLEVDRGQGLAIIAA